MSTICFYIYFLTNVNLLIFGLKWLYSEYLYFLCHQKWKKNKRKKSAKNNESLSEFLLSLYWLFQSIREWIKWMILHKQEQLKQFKNLIHCKTDWTESMNYLLKILLSKKLKRLIQVRYEFHSNLHRVKILKQSLVDKLWIYQTNWMALLLWKHISDEKLKCSA